MGFIEIDLIRSDPYAKLVTAHKIAENFIEVVDVHVVEGEHDLLIETDIDDYRLIDLMDRIKAKLPTNCNIKALYKGPMFL